MPRKSLDDLGELQRAVIEIVWELGEANVEQVRARLPRRPAYTTVLTVLQKLERAGWLRHRAEGRSYVWRAARTRQAEGVSALKRFAERVFDGDRRLLFEHLLADEKLSAKDLDELRRMIDARRKGGAP